MLAFGAKKEAYDGIERHNVARKVFAFGIYDCHWKQRRKAKELSKQEIRLSIFPHLFVFFIIFY